VAARKDEAYECDHHHGAIHHHQRPSLHESKDNSPARRQGADNERGHAIGKPEAVRIVFSLFHMR
jgi:hypothetical protein